MRIRPIIVVLAACCCAMGESYNALAPAGEPVEWRDTGGYAVALPAEPTPQEKYAAQLLIDGVKAMTGVTWETAAEAGGGPVVRLATSGSLGDEGYRISEAGGDWLLEGGSRRGPINAVLAFLEEDLGWRDYSIFVPQYFPDWRGRRFAATPRSYRPVWENREIYTQTAWNSGWAVRNRLAPLFHPTGPEIPAEAGGSPSYPGGWFAHTFEHLAPGEEVFQAHPEYFALINGTRSPRNFCLTADGIVPLAAANVGKVLDQYPRAAYFSLSLNDGPEQVCQCPDCAALAAKEGSKAGPLLHFVNRVAAIVGETHPGVKISTLAYLETVKPPATIRPAGNVIIFLATDKHIWANPYHMVTETGEFRQALAEWNAIGAQMQLWDYIFADNSQLLKPAPNFDVIAGNLRFYRDFPGLTGLMLQDNHSSYGGSRAAMKNWVVSKLLWNPDWDIEALVRDFTYGYYGAAGDAMQRYNDLLRGEWLAYHQRVRPADAEPFAFSENFLLRAMALLQEAADAVAGDPVRAKEVEREMACLHYYRLMTDDFPEGDDAAWREAVETMRDYCNRLDITCFTESAPLEQQFLAWEGRLTRGLIRPSTPNAVFLAPDTVYLPQMCGTGNASIVKAPDALTGSAIRQPGGQSAWSIQWWITPTTFLQGAGPHVVRLRIKPGPLRGEGAVAWCGVYDSSAKVTRCERQVTAAELAGEGYRFVEIGVIDDLRRDLCVFAGAAPDCAVEYFDVDLVELVPVAEYSPK